jgi:hypothetical protein
MARTSSLNFETCLKEHFLDKGVFVINEEELRKSKSFTAETYFKIQCKSNPKHTYQSCVMKIKKFGVDITVCPFCKRYGNIGVPLVTFQEYANKNNLIIKNEKPIYRREDDEITFICNLCSHPHTVKSVKYFEENTVKNQYICQGCKNIKVSIIVSKLYINEADIVKTIIDERKDIVNYLSSLTENVVEQNNKTLIAPLVLDIVVNDKLAIDYVITRFYSNIDKNYHKNKLDACAAKGIRLITIFDDEWNNKKDICKSRIRNALGMTKTSIGARECTISKITKEDAGSFCNKNHIQGAGKSTTSYGLFYKNELEAVMTFYKSNIDDSWSLDRFCSLLDIEISGGAQRLLRAFDKEFPGVSITTYCDLRWGTGGVYHKMGFTLIKNSNINYYYIGAYTNWERKDRRHFTKQNLIEIFDESENTNLTEEEIAQKNGLVKIYGAGNLKFIK